MINKLKSLTNTEDKKRLLSNFFSLSVLQGANYILPLITLPYLVRVLGVEYFGLLAFATATIAYFQILTDYGFDLTATREISVNRDNKEKVVEIFSSVMIIKFALMILSFLLLILLVFSFEKFREDYLVYLLTFGVVVGQVLFPVWFFQGMERMKYITYLNILSKTIFTVAIFIFVQEKEDFYIVPILTSIGFIVAGIWSLYIVKKEFKVSFKLQTINTVKQYLIDGWYVFVSRFYVSLYTTTNVVLLGLFTNNTVVGYYSIADKIVAAIGGLFTPVNQVIYPYFAKVYKENKDKFVNMINKTAFIFLIASIVLFVISYIAKEYLVFIVSGKYDLEIIAILSIYLVTIITAPFGAFYTQILIIQKRNKEFNKIVRNTFLVNLILSPLFIYFYNGIGLAISNVLVQIYVVSLCLNYIKKGV